MDYVSAAVWSTSYKNNLPDSAFLYVESGGKKDEEGKTTPRSLRHFPYKDSSGKIDLIHLRNAIARIPIAAIPKGLKKPLQDKARRLLKDSKKKSKSNLFVANLNKICAQNNLTANVKTDDTTIGPCCGAHNFYSRQDVTVKKISDLYVHYVENLVALPNGDKEFEKYYIFNVNDGILRFLDNYCSCKKYAGGLDEMQITYVDVDPADLNPPESIDLDAEKSCENTLTALIDGSTNPLSMIDTINQGLDASMSHLGYRAVRTYLKNFATGLTFLIDYVKTSPLASHLVNTDNFKDFINDMCRLRASDRSLYGTVINTSFQESLNPFLRESAREEMAFIRTNLSTSGSDSLVVNCPPSANDNTIGALAAALGVSAASVAVALAALRRGKTKQCSDVAVTARNLAPLLIAATGASFATTQTSEATVQERLQAVLQKDCEGRLPYSCGEGGFEGSDDGDDSGEVDAPGGGGGIDQGLL